MHLVSPAFVMYFGACLVFVPVKISNKTRNHTKCEYEENPVFIGGFSDLYHCKKHSVTLLFFVSSTNYNQPQTPVITGFVTMQKYHLVLVWCLFLQKETPRHNKIQNKKGGSFEPPSFA